MMRDRELDVTLCSADVVNPWLAGCLLAAAEAPNSVKAVVVSFERHDTAVELQDSTGIASGCILFFSAHGAIHVLGAVDPHNEPFTKRRSLEELRSAQTIALREREYRNRCLRVYDTCLYGALPLLVLAALSWFIRWLW